MMRTSRVACNTALFTAIAVAVAAASAVPKVGVETPELPIRNGEIGFVISEIGWALGPDADKSAACPRGLTTTASLLYEQSPEGRRREGETEQDYQRRIRDASGRGPSAAEACLSPEKFGPDPLYRTVSGKNLLAEGLDLDGQDSRSGGRAAANSCAHDDFQRADGERGIDNQLYGAVGCTTGFQSNGGKRGFGTEMLTGAWGILIRLRGVDSIVNDDNVEVTMTANGDPIQLSPARSPLAHASYTMDSDPRFRAQTRGRIVAGVLTTDPVNVRFRTVTAGMYMERPIDDARLRLLFNKAGGVEGIMGGYTKVDEFYDFVVGYRQAKDATGKPIPVRAVSGRAAGSSTSAGLTCNGIYFALKQMADGQRDPKTGECQAISNQYKIKAVPAFVIDPLPGASLAKTN
jgi:hypothetical protein